MIVVELFILRFSLAQAHQLNIGDEQFYLVVGDKRDRVEQQRCPLVVHLCRIVESKIIKGLGPSVVIIAR